MNQEDCILNGKDFFDDVKKLAENLENNPIEKNFSILNKKISEVCSDFQAIYGIVSNACYAEFAWLGEQKFDFIDCGDKEKDIDKKSFFENIQQLSNELENDSVEENFNALNEKIAEVCPNFQVIFNLVSSAYYAEFVWSAKQES